MHFLSLSDTYMSLQRAFLEELHNIEVVLFSYYADMASSNKNPFQNNASKSFKNTCLGVAIRYHISAFEFPVIAVDQVSDHTLVWKSSCQCRAFSSPL